MVGWVKPLIRGEGVSSLNVSIVIPEKLSYGGGGEMFVAEVSKYLKSRKFNVTIIQKGTNNEFDLDTDNSSNNGVPIITLEYERVTAIGLKFFSQPLPKMAFFKRFDVNMIMCYRLPAKKSIIEMKKEGISVVFLFHGITFEEFSIFNLKASLFSIYNKVYLKIVGNKYKEFAFKFQVINQTTKNVLTDSGIEEANVHLPLLGVNEIPNVQFVEEDKFIVIVVGRLENLQKGIDRLLKVIKLAEKIYHNNIEFQVVGKGKDDWHLISGSRRLSNLKFFGYVDRNVKFELLSKASLFLCTSNIEPFGFALIEALLMGLPVVSTPVSGPKFILSKDPLFGKISTFRTKKLLLDISEFHSLWARDRIRYLQIKKYISLKSKSLFSQDDMLADIEKLVRGA